MDPSDWISAKVEQLLCQLLENRHLYQSLQVDRDALLSVLQVELIENRSNVQPDELKAKFDEALDADWYAQNEMTVQHTARHSLPPGMEFQPKIAFFPRDITASCATCKKVMPMNLVRSLDLAEIHDHEWGLIKRPTGHQDFVFLFQCQSCKSQPDAFLVRRRGLKLTLCGRSPMEYVPVPPFLPRDVQRYYSDAIVAAQSGKTLAGLFYLRVLVEQYLRTVVPDSAPKKPDELINLYAAMLPEDFKQHFPSLGEQYTRLSEAIHTANESDELFQKSLERIATHFDGIRVFEKASGKKLF